ncbi:hypothetical protein ART_0342 [Arthrobacter sp. PAMC 25486]|nr:hypothetical protein [Arthrobacter sp. PAMC 25486]AIX99940.1 hypothetical protein ART_0342 [Arthrobacter sp. PAMC 25486]
MPRRTSAFSYSIGLLLLGVSALVALVFTPAGGQDRTGAGLAEYGR